MSIEAQRYAEAISLRNGAPALVRAIRLDDRERLQTAFLGLDPESVYLRYFSYKHELSEADLDRLCNPDFHERVVLVVTQPGSTEEIIIASAGYVAHDGADSVRAAEVAFAVAEDVQGQGLSSKLLAVLAELARADGVQRFDAEVLSRNAAMLSVFEHSGLPMQVGAEQDGVISVSLSLAAPTAAGASR